MELPPSWFKKALGSDRESLYVPIQCEGEKDLFVHVHRYGLSKAVKKQALVFVHGGGASNCWWDFIAPWFMDKFEVVCLSQTGCGNSSWKDKV